MSAMIGVVVLGMGRSGTSSVTRMLAGAGFFAGRQQDLMPAADANPTGHWENMNVWKANEQVLQRLGGSWFDPPPATAQTAAGEWAVPLLRVEVERIAHQSNGAPIVIKDPRIGVMMPLWDPILRNRLHPIIVIRDPVEIAHSLLRRDGTPLPLGLAAWELHMTILLDHIQGRLVTVAPYARLVGDEQLAPSIVEAAAAHVDPELTESLRPAGAANALDPDLYRNRVAGSDHHQRLTSSQLELWRFLDSLTTGDQPIDVPDALRAPCGAAQESVRAETERVASENERAQLARDLEVQREQNNALGSDLAAQHEQNSALMSDLTAEREHNGALGDSLAGERQRSANLSMNLQAERERAEAATESHAQAELWLASIQSSASWRITRPLRAVKRYLR
jgi:hypothetical protein